MFQSTFPFFCLAIKRLNQASLASVGVIPLQVCCVKIRNITSIGHEMLISSFDLSGRQFPWENKWSLWATVTTVVTAPGPNDHGSVTARLGHSSVTARSQLSQGEVTAQSRLDHSSITA